MDDPRKLLERALGLCSATEAEVVYSGGTTAVTRFAENQATQNTSRRVRTLSVTATIDRRSGTASTNDVTDTGLKKVVDRAHAIVKFLPEDPEYVAPLGPQAYRSVEAYEEATAAFGPADRAAGVKQAIKIAGDLRAAGTFSNGESVMAMMNKNGLYGAYRSTSAGFSTTMRTKDGTGSSRSEVRGYRNVADIDVEAIARRTADRARKSAGPSRIKPGNYTVVLEPQAVADLVGVLGRFMDRRAADEGRNFFAGKIGKKIAHERITMRTEVEHPMHRGTPFNGEGLPIDDLAWIEKGVLQRLPTGRYWAKKSGVAPTPGLSSIVISGEDRSVEELIADTKQGLLITRFWYIRTVDAKKMLMTGLTRDGTFKIENGSIAAPVINYRFNESPIALLKNVEAMSRGQKIGGWIVPAMRVRDFTLTSPSEAI